MQCEAEGKERTQGCCRCLVVIVIVVVLVVLVMGGGGSKSLLLLLELVELQGTLLLVTGNNKAVLG